MQLKDIKDTLFKTEIVFKFTSYDELKSFMDKYNMSELEVKSVDYKRRKDKNVWRIVEL